VEIQHATWSRRTVEAGDPVLIELSGCTRRYSGSLLRTFVVQGEPTEPMRRAEEAIEAGLEAAIAALKPGVRSGDVDAACRVAVEAAGFSYPHETAYSIGCCFPPGWNETHVFNLHPGDERVVQANMTFHMVPAVTIPGAGAYGRSETVLVTEHGAEVLTDFPRGLIRM
jgi:Xaa-Pro aminopeptidase